MSASTSGAVLSRRQRSFARAVAKQRRKNADATRAGVVLRWAIIERAVERCLLDATTCVNIRDWAQRCAQYEALQYDVLLKGDKLKSYTNEVYKKVKEKYSAFELPD